MSDQLAEIAAWESSLGDTAKRVLEYLGSGLNPVSAAMASGCSPEYVAELMAGKEFSSAVAIRRGATMSKYAKMDALADDMQLEALEQLKRTLKYETKTCNVLRVIDTLDKMKRRSTPAVGADAASGVQRVRITLPALAAQQYTVAVDINNKVIQIGTDTLLPANGPIIEGLVREHQQARERLNHDSELNSGRAAGAV